MCKSTEENCICLKIPKSVTPCFGGKDLEVMIFNSSYFQSCKTILLNQVFDTVPHTGAIQELYIFICKIHMSIEGNSLKNVLCQCFSPFKVTYVVPICPSSRLLMFSGSFGFLQQQHHYKWQERVFMVLLTCINRLFIA